MNDGVCLAIEVDEAARPPAPRDRLRRPLTLDPSRGARGRARGGGRRGRCRSRWSATRPRSSPTWAAGGEQFDVVTDQTSAHDALNGYVPAEISLDDARRCARPRRRLRAPRSKARWPTTSGRCSRSRTAGAVVFDYGNNLRAQAQEAGVADAFDFPGFVPAFIRPQFCEGRGPFRWAALSGDPADIRRDRPRDPRAVPRRRRACAAGSRWPEAKVPFQGLPARICWLGYGERAKAGLAFNELVASGEVSGADRHRPRPPRLGLGGLAEPRDRGDGGRLGRGRRLAAAQRDGQHRGGRDLGLDPPRRRRRASATASTPAWSSSPTGPSSRPRSSSASSRPTRAWASSATSTPATSARRGRPRARRAHPDARRVAA